MKNYLDQGFLSFIRETSRLNEDMKRQAVQALYSTSIPPEYADLTFNGFRALAGDEPEKQAAIALTLHYATNNMSVMDDGYPKRSLLIWGPPGVGKTGLLTSIFKKLAMGRTCLWISLLGLANQIRDGYGSGDAYKKIRVATQVDLLFLDDVGSLGRQRATEGMNEIMEAIIFERHAQRRPTLMTSNKAPAELGCFFTEAIYQRIAAMAMVIEMGGRVLRKV